ncbi:MAG: SMP-30/gluconolactonase/LRE family protein [Bacteroidales bacterium]|nr:SMP-30/gluconolactonase/LRE family protein [Bacteroidales bacterium]
MKKNTIFSITGATLFFLLPGILSAQIVDKNSIIAPGATVEKLGTGYSFTEGPAADKNGNVYFTDQPNNKIIRWDAETGAFTTFSDQSGRSNGMYFDAKGNLIACADMDNQLWSFDKSGKATVLIKDYEGKLLNGPNDLWIHPKGGIYITDPYFRRNYWKRTPATQQDGQHLYYLTPDRSKLTRVDETLVQPNGLIGTPDGKKLYVADPGAKKIYVYDIQKDGSLANKTQFASVGSDGMTMDNQGNIYVTGKGVTVLDKNGNEIAQIPIQENWTANVCFGGKNHDILFITASKSVYAVKMNVKGI